MFLFLQFQPDGLVNELVLSFRVLKSCVKFESSPIILSRVIMSTDAGQMTDRQILSQKPFFRTQGFSKRKGFIKIPKTIFYMKYLKTLNFNYKLQIRIRLGLLFILIENLKSISIHLQNFYENNKTKNAAFKKTLRY